MTPSRRFLLPIAALALACGVVVWPRWLQPRSVDPCAHPDVLTVTALIPGSRPDKERRDKLDADHIQWSEGRINDPQFPRDPLVFRIVRSYSVLKAAERPLALLPEPLEPESVHLEWVEVPGGPLPVHVVRSAGQQSMQIAAYAFVFGNEPIASPFAAQLRGMLRELRDGRRPLTVLLAGGRATFDTAPYRDELAKRWIAAAWEHYRGMCIGGSAPSTGALGSTP